MAYTLPVLGEKQQCMAQEEGARGVWPLGAGDARACVWLWRPVSSWAADGEEPQSPLVALTMGSQGRVAAQTDALRSGVTGAASNPFTHPQGTPRRFIQARDGLHSMHLRPVTRALDWDAQDTPGNGDSSGTGGLLGRIELAE